jgi:hypothetical protein
MPVQLTMVSAHTLVDLSEFVKCGAKTAQITQLVHDLRVHRSVGAKSRREFPALWRRHCGASQCVFQFWSQICPPTQFTLDVESDWGDSAI